MGSEAAKRKGLGHWLILDPVAKVGRFTSCHGARFVRFVVAGRMNLMVAGWLLPSLGQERLHDPVEEGLWFFIQATNQVVAKG